jgi:hypothetical protein
VEPVPTGKEVDGVDVCGVIHTASRLAVAVQSGQEKIEKIKLN